MTASGDSVSADVDLEERRHLFPGSPPARGVRARGWKSRIRHASGCTLADDGAENLLYCHS